MGHSIQYRNEVTLSLHVRDIRAAIQWYQEMLGLKVLYHLEDMGWCEMSSHMTGVTVGLGQSEDVQCKGGCVPVWTVTDIDEARGYLEGRQVRFDGPTIEIPEFVKLATFYDPDGNAWMLAQSLQAPQG